MKTKVDPGPMCIPDYPYGVGLIAYNSKYRGNHADCVHDRFGELTGFLLAIKSANFLTEEILRFHPVLRFSI